MENQFVRETPAPEPLQRNLQDPTHPDVGPSKGKLEEPLLETDQIQGSILPGFNKDHRILMFLNIIQSEQFKCWLKTQVPYIATAEEVLTFNRLFKFTKARRGNEGTIKSTWTNVAFSYNGIGKLTTDKDFKDGPFIAGLAAQSASLGDPTDPSAEGCQKNWLIGGEDNEADIMFIVEADDRCDVLAEVERIENSLVTFNKANKLQSDFASVIFKDEAANLPKPLGGHEHFGFKDGISQPGIRGRISDNVNDVLTIRQNHLKRDNFDTDTPPQFQSAQGKPGQDLLWPGEFVFGYKHQDRCKPINEPSEHDANAGPEWAKNGSYLVYRRLRQDVGAFHTFLKDTAKALNISDPVNSSAAALVGSKLVGRWASGAPVLREPIKENQKLGSEDCANNNFEYQSGSKNLPRLSPTDTDFSVFNCIDEYDHSTGDKNGLKCPFSGHIRKAYPRDDETEKKNKTLDTDKECCNDSRIILGESDTQTHRLLRRGLPYGPVSRSTPETPFNEKKEEEEDRGLQFLAYQTSIERQFEFVTKCWINNPDFKEPKGTSTIGDPIIPKLQGGGYDPIIGQNSAAGRIRDFTVTIPDSTNPDIGKAVRVSTNDFFKKTEKTDWVIPTGGGYFFTPSIEALEQVFSNCDEPNTNLTEIA